MRQRYLPGGGGLQKYKVLLGITHSHKNTSAEVEKIKKQLLYPYRDTPFYEFSMQTKPLDINKNIFKVTTVVYNVTLL